jgi:aspartate aminotransferase-like enzyme
VLVLSNGAYGRRMEEMCAAAGIQFDSIRSSEIAPFDLDQVRKPLTKY